MAVTNSLSAMSDYPIPLSSKPSLPLPNVLSAICSPTRWAILRELAGGDQVAVVELAERLGETATGISKHMAVLRNAGVVNVGRNRLYSLSPACKADEEQRIIDFGWCVLRLGAERLKAERLNG